MKFKNPILSHLFPEILWLSRSSLFLRGGGVYQTALQEPAGGHGAQWVPVPEEAGGAEDKAD